MKGKKFTRGTGITKRTFETLPLMDGLRKIEYQDKMTAAQGRGRRGSLPWLLDTIEEEAKEILEQAGLPTDEGPYSFLHDEFANGNA
jgi:hypothetical protein